MSAHPTPKSSPPSPKKWAKNSSATVRATDRRQGFVSILHSDGANRLAEHFRIAVDDFNSLAPCGANRVGIEEIYFVSTRNYITLKPSKCNGFMITRLVSIRNYIALKLQLNRGATSFSLVSIRNYIALKHYSDFQTQTVSLVSIRNYIALKLGWHGRADYSLFSIHTKLHRSKTLDTQHGTRGV